MRLLEFIVLHSLFSCKFQEHRSGWQQADFFMMLYVMVFGKRLEWEWRHLTATDFAQYSPKYTRKYFMCSSSAGIFERRSRSHESQFRAFKAMST